MRFKERDNFGKERIVQVSWSDHTGQCERCSRVNLAKSATYTEACPTGSQLLMERLIAEQRPAQQEKERQVREWAKKTGVFKDA